MDNDRIIKELANKYNLDERVIRSITSSPFLFSKKVMGSLEDERPVRIPYMGCFVIRRHKNKDLLQIMILKYIVLDLIKQVEENNISEQRDGLLQAIMTIKDKLIDKGYRDEQLVQHIIEWQNRA